MTLPQLQQLYSRTHARLLAELDVETGDRVLARHAIQEAFAGAARARFSFRSEQAAVSWLTIKIAQIVEAGLPLGCGEEIFEWPDVLRRAKIATGSPTARPA